MNPWMMCVKVCKFICEPHELSPLLSAMLSHPSVPQRRVSTCTSKEQGELGTWEMFSDLPAKIEVFCHVPIEILICFHASTSVSRMQILNLQPSVSNGFLRCWNLQCWNLRCWNLRCWNLQCWNLRCWNLRCWNLRCWNLRCWNMRAGFAPVHVRSLQIWHESHFSVMSSGDIPNSTKSMLKLMSFSSNVYITKNLHMFHTCPRLLWGWKWCRRWCSVGWDWLLASESSLPLSIFQPAKSPCLCEGAIAVLAVLTSFWENLQDFVHRKSNQSVIVFPVWHLAKESSQEFFFLFHDSWFMFFVFFLFFFSFFCFVRFVINFVEAWGGADWVSRISFRSSLKLELQELHSLDNCCTSVVSCETLLGKPKAMENTESFGIEMRMYYSSQTYQFISLFIHRFSRNISYSSTYCLVCSLPRLHHLVTSIYLLCNVSIHLYISQQIFIYQIYQSILCADQLTNLQ